MKMETTAETRARRERGSGRILQIGRIWWIQYYSRGQAVRESSRSERPGVAEKLLKLRLAQVRTGNHPELRRVTYEDLRAAYIADYVTNHRKSLRYDKDGKPGLDKVDRLDKFFADYRATDIDADLMREFAKKLQAEGKRDSTINRSLSALRRMFNLAKREGKIRDVPYFPLLTEPAPR
jgi:integrase